MQVCSWTVVKSGLLIFCRRRWAADGIDEVVNPPDAQHNQEVPANKGERRISPNMYTYLYMQLA